ncbi:MAG: sodium-dependent transporter [Muribaculaceae bacterium]|nr:sodium-dependent transporter [Muribaculaceae bacterium]
MANNQFSSRIGLIAATVGSAVGLGTVWRFPAETQQGGGAAFLLLYIFFVLILGIPVMLGEFTVGRAGGSDPIGSFTRLSGNKQVWKLAGALGVMTAFLILTYYMVVAGWTVEYLWQSITGSLYQPTANIGNEAVADADFTAKMAQGIQSVWSPVIFTAIIIALNIFILIGGITKGIERLSNILMPMLFLLLLGFCFVTLSLPKAAEGLDFFFRPDFSRITPTVCLKALGQAFFSLSLGMGILITYASYFPASTRLIRTSVTVSSIVLVVAIMMGIIIFPAVMSFGLEDHAIAGTGLVFVTLPEVFSRMPLTRLWSALFFLLLGVAAVTSTISMAEVPIRFVQDRFHFSRRNAVLIILLPFFVFSTVCSLSLGVWSHITLFGMTLFDLLDYVTSNIMLPLAALSVCLFLGWFAPKDLLHSQLTNNGQLTNRLVGIISFIIRWIAPILICILLISPLF